MSEKVDYFPKATALDEIANGLERTTTMTTAREEAERLFRTPRMHVGTASDREAFAFAEGASWAVADDDAKVEAMASAMFGAVSDSPRSLFVRWEELPEEWRIPWRGQARAALSALRRSVESGGQA